MYEILKQNWDKTKYFIIFGFIITFLLLLTVVYKGDDKITKKSESNKVVHYVPDLNTFKKFSHVQLDQSK